MEYLDESEEKCCQGQLGYRPPTLHVLFIGWFRIGVWTFTDFLGRPSSSWMVCLVVAKTLREKRKRSLVLTVLRGPLTIDRWPGHLLSSFGSTHLSWPWRQWRRRHLSNNNLPIRFFFLPCRKSDNPCPLWQTSRNKLADCHIES